MLILPLQISDDLPDFESPDSIDRDQLKGDLETAVTQYLSQVKELGLYKDSRETNNIKFTTFKNPTLPRKTGRKPVAPKPPTAPPVLNSPTVDEQLLDVKFRLVDEHPKNEDSIVSKTGEDSSVESQALDNPLYLSLSHCSSGSQKGIEEPFYQNSDIIPSDEEEHIYENVDAAKFNLYDTIAQPPRPKLPPKSTTNSSSTVTNEKSHSKELNKKGPLQDGSETSDLGSSGSEDANSEEDWPLPPCPAPEEETSTTDVPLPPPPPELALQQLEEEVLRVEEEERKQTLLRKKKKKISFHLPPSSKSIKEEDKESQQQSPPVPLNEELSGTSEQIEGDNEFPSIRHSVIIELKDSLGQPPSSISSRIDESKQTDENQRIYIQRDNQFDSSIHSSKSINDSVIEISDDGSWEMKGSEENSLSSSAAIEGQEIDRFTGQPIMISHFESSSPPSSSNPPIPSFEVKKTAEELEPEIYFDERKSIKDYSFDSSDGVYSASCVETTTTEPSLKNETNNNSIPLHSEASKSSSNNLGAAIMEGYERDLQKKKDNLNLPEVSLLEFGEEDVKELEMQRRCVIDQMTVKAKKKNSWIRDFRTESAVVDSNEEISLNKPNDAKPRNESKPQFLGKTVKFAAAEASSKKTKSEQSKNKTMEGFLGKCFQTPGRNLSNKADTVQKKKPAEGKIFNLKLHMHFTLACVLRIGILL